MVGPAVLAEPVDPVAARDIAGRYLSRRAGEWTARAKKARTAPQAIEVAAQAAAGNAEVTPLVDPDTGATLGYVIQTQPVGYVVTPADTDVRPVIAFSFESNFSFEECPENILLNIVRVDLKGELAARATVPEEKRAANHAWWASLAGGQAAAGDGDDEGGGIEGSSEGGEDTGIWGPWLDTYWSQGYHYNKYCPIDPLTSDRCVTGCVATAGGQIINYWQYPRSVTFDASDSYWSVYDPWPIDSYGVRIIWIDAPPLSIPNIDYGGHPDDPNQPTDDMVGRLLAAVGVTAQMGYTSVGSGAGGVPFKTGRWGYDHYDRRDPNFPNDFKNSMKAGRPAYCSISYLGEGPGHAIVCDGYWEAGNPPGTLELFHFNFGWAGSTNGWYSQASFAPMWYWGGGGSSPVPPAPEIVQIDPQWTPAGEAYTGPTPEITADTQSRPVTWSLDTNASGMTIDPNTGVVEWSPAEPQSLYVVTLYAENEAGQDDMTFYLVVGDPAPGPPVIDDIADANIPAGTPYAEQPILSQGTFPIAWSFADPNDDPNYETPPAGMTIDPVTGAVDWTPGEGEIGNQYQITIKAENGDGNDVESWSLTVEYPPEGPRIAEIPDANTVAGVPYLGPTPVLEQGAPPIIWSLPDPNNVAAGMTIDENTGIISWQPGYGPATWVETITIKAENGAGFFDTESYALTIQPPAGPPDIAEINDLPVAMGQPCTGPGPDPNQPAPILLQGSPVVTWSFAEPNEVPVGMAIDPATGILMWDVPVLDPNDPNASITLSIKAENADGNDVESFDLILMAPPEIGEIADQSIPVGVAYTGPSPDPNGSDPNLPEPNWPEPNLVQGTPPLTWSFPDPNDPNYPTPPPGMSIDPNTGVVTWFNPIKDPNDANNPPYTVTIQVENAVGSDQETFQLTVLDPPIIDEIANRTVVSGELYVETPSLSQGDPTVTWSFADPNDVPLGMTIDPNNGVVAWQNPVAGPQPYTVTIRAQNAAGADEASWQLTVLMAPVIEEIDDHGVAGGVPYTGPAPTLLQGSLPVTWSLPDPNNVQAGITINPGTGAISWANPTLNESPQTVTIRAENTVGADEASWQITVLDLDAPEIDQIPARSVVEGNQYDELPNLSQGSPPVTWSFVDPNDDPNYAPPPSGMTIDPDTGQITWPSPVVDGSPYALGIRAANVVGFDTVALQLTVTTMPVPPQIEAIADRSVVEGGSYSETPVLLQGTLPVTWSFANPGGIPAGMTIDPNTGKITWPESVAHPDGPDVVYDLAIQAANDGGTDTEVWLLHVMVPPQIVTLGDIEPAEEGTPYVGPVPEATGTGPIEWVLKLGPAGMTIDPDTGQVSWPEPDPNGSPRTVTVEARNGAGADEADFELPVEAAPVPPEIAAMDDASTTDGQAYASPAPTLTQGSEPVTWSFAAPGSVPAGMTINPTTGVVSWPNPTTNGSPYAVTILASNKAGDDDASWQLTVAPQPVAPSIGEIPNDSVDEGEAYTGPAPTATGTQPMTWSLVDWPSGMTIDPATGVVTWPNPTLSGSPHTVTIRASNGAGADNESWQLTVAPKPVAPDVAAIPDRDVVEGQAYTETPRLTRGTLPVTWSFVDPGSVPAGMTINPSTGVVSWPNPTVEGSPHAVSIRATNETGTPDEEGWVVTVTKATVTVTIGISPANVGLTVTVDGQPHTGVSTFSWEVGSTHEVSVASPQTGSDKSIYEFDSWLDGASTAERTLQVASTSSYTAEMAEIIAAGIAILGPPTVPENKAVQYACQLTMSDGSTQDVTDEVSWRLTSQDAAQINKGLVVGKEVTHDEYTEIRATYAADDVNLPSAGLPITILNMLKTFELTVSRSPAGAGAPVRSTHQEKAPVSIPVPDPPEAGMVFVAWGGDASGTADPLVITMDQDKTVIAQYEKPVIPPTGFCGTPAAAAGLALVTLLAILRGHGSTHRRRATSRRRKR